LGGCEGTAGYKIRQAVEMGKRECVGGKVLPRGRRGGEQGGQYGESGFVESGGEREVGGCE